MSAGSDNARYVGIGLIAVEVRIGSLIKAELVYLLIHKFSLSIY